MIKHCLFSFVLFCFGIQGQGQLYKRFSLGANFQHKGYTNVNAKDLFSTDKGYGFESIEGVYAVHRGGKKLGADFITSNHPFYFSVNLPEGNYQVKLLLGDTKGTSIATIRVECRRLMIKEITTSYGELKKVALNVHIRDSVNHITGKAVKLKPREKPYFHWDNKLTIEFNNTSAKVAAIEISKDSIIPTIFLAGNSTVVDQAEDPWASWGQMIPSFFKPGIVVANYAESGETLKAFENEGRLSKLWSMSKPGDYLFVEFAHNDQKPGGNHLDPFTSYQEKLTDWVSQAKAHGMHIVFVTSTNRRSFDSTGHIYNSLGDYPEAMRQLAHKLAVPLIDLNAMSKDFYEALGPVASTKAFVYFKANAYPNQPNEVKDDTHFNTYGAYVLAKCVAKGIQELIPGLAIYLQNNFTSFDPAMPDNPSNFHLPEGN